MYITENLEQKIFYKPIISIDFAKASVLQLQAAERKIHFS